MKQNNRGVRGIRHPVPQGTLIGRRINGGFGAPEFITFQELASYVASFSGVISPPVPPTGQFHQVQTTAGSGAVMLLSGVTARVLNLTLAAGLWDLSASVTFDPNGAASTSFTDAIVAISFDPSILPSPPNGGGYVENTHNMSITGSTTLATGVMRVTLSAPAPVWLLARATFS